MVIDMKVEPALMPPGIGITLHVHIILPLPHFQNMAQIATLKITSKPNFFLFLLFLFLFLQMSLKPFLLLHDLFQ